MFNATCVLRNKKEVFLNGVFNEKRERVKVCFCGMSLAAHVKNVGVCIPQLMRTELLSNQFWPCGLLY